MNSREKGKRGERQWRDELRANGFEARRGQQFCGSPESPDVVCPALPWLHFEVKAVERLNIEEAMEQARRDCRRAETGNLKPELGGVSRVPVVAHRRSFRPWLVTMEAETFFNKVLVRKAGCFGCFTQCKSQVDVPGVGYGIGACMDFISFVGTVWNQDLATIWLDKPTD